MNNDFEKIEEEIVQEEKVLEKAAKKSILSKPWFQSIIGIFIVLIAFVGFLFWRLTSGKVSIENSLISAPVIDLSPTTPGILQDIYVKDGDAVTPDMPVAKVGDEIITAKVSGIVVTVNNQEGQVFSHGQAVVSMVNTDQERVVGKIDEDKGLKDIKVGQPATFTVDAFGTEKFVGVVDEISEISDQTSVVFDISDQRAVQQFDVKVRFDVNQYPQLKDGMSAKITVFTK